MIVRAGVELPVAQIELGRAAQAALDAAGAPAPASIGLVLTDDRELSTLNARYMGEEQATDVLSFPLLPRAAFPPHEGQHVDVRTGGAALAGEHSFVLPPGQRTHLGDVVVSVERAAVQARTGSGGQTSDVRWSVRHELRLLVVHGTLHVCGWDHALPQEEAAMRAAERRILAALGTSQVDAVSSAGASVSAADARARSIGGVVPAGRSSAGRDRPARCRCARRCRA